MGAGKDVSSREEERHKGKFQYIAFITGGAPWTSNTSKSTMKRKIVELMVVNKKHETTSTKSP